MSTICPSTGKAEEGRLQEANLGSTENQKQKQIKLNKQKPTSTRTETVSKYQSFQD